MNFKVMKLYEYRIRNCFGNDRKNWGLVSNLSKRIIIYL